MFFFISFSHFFRMYLFLLTKNLLCQKYAPFLLIAKNTPNTFSQCLVNKIQLQRSLLKFVKHTKPANLMKVSLNKCFLFSWLSVGIF